MISAAAMISGHCLAAAKQPGQKTHVQMLLALVRYSQGSNSMSPFKLGGLAVRTHLPPRVEPTFLGGGGVPGVGARPDRSVLEERPGHAAVL